MRSRTLIPADDIGVPCGCRECVDAGVATEPQRRVPSEIPDGAPRWLHGWDLLRLLEAQRGAFAILRQKLR